MSALLVHVGGRLLTAIPQLLGVLVVSFFLLKLIPGDPAPMMLGPLATQEALDKLRAEMGLDRPLPVQLSIYLDKLAHGDLGRSWQTTNPVLKDLAMRFPATLELITLGMLVALAIGFPLGVAAARKPDGWRARAANVFGFGAGAIPDFWLGLVLIYVFYTQLGWAPPPLGRLDFAVFPPPTITGSYLIDTLVARDWEALRSAVSQLVLPVLTLGVVAAGPVLKVTRAAVQRTLDADFIRFARAKGLSPRRVSRHAVRNALGSITTVVGSLYGTLIGGAVLVEVVFSWGGAGQYAVGAVLNADINAALGFVIFAAVSTLLIYLIVDLIHFAVEPRGR